MNRSRAAARLMILRRLLTERQIGSQEELVTLLAERGHTVTQATVSRDLANLGAVKIRGEEGHDVYSLPATSVSDSEAMVVLGRRMQEFALSIDYSLNIVVLKTVPGAGPTVAAALDEVSLDLILGTIGGDDTVLIVSKAADGSALAQRLRDILEDRT